VVAMGMSDVNGYEILSALDEPVDEFLRMFNGQKRIDKDGIALTMNQCGGVGNPGQPRKQNIRHFAERSGF